MAAISLEEILTKPFVNLMLDFIESTPEDELESHLSDLLGTEILDVIKEMAKTAIGEPTEGLTFKALLEAFATQAENSLWGGSLLHYAASLGCTETISAFLEKGVPIDTKDHLGRTALYFAASMGRTETVIALIEKGAAIDPITNSGGWTALRAAVWERRAETAIALIDRGAAIDVADSRGMTPLHCAANVGNTKAAIALIEKGAAIDATDNDGMTPLHRASSFWTESVIALIKRGAAIDATDNDGMTPLHRAVSSFWKESVITLIEHGATIDATNANNETALTIALNNERPDLDMAFILRLKGAAMSTNDMDNPAHQEFETKFNGFIEHCRKVSNFAVSGVPTLTFLCHSAINQHNVSLEGQSTFLVAPTLTKEQSVLYHMNYRKVPNPNVHNIYEILSEFEAWDPGQEASSSESATPRAG